MAAFGMPAHRLDRFLEAQNQPAVGFAAALAEINAGRKRGHWIWYVFPQLAGLGSSWASIEYGISGIDEAIEYVEHPLLRSRLLEITRAAAAQLRDGAALNRLMGSQIDALKLVSSLTLFHHAATRLAGDGDRLPYADLVNAAGDVLAAAGTQGYPPCAFTLDRLGTS
jgi:uncharacterized protein (DUF1810 family)